MGQNIPADKDVAIEIIWRTLYGDATGEGIVAKTFRHEGVWKWFVVTVRIMVFMSPLIGAAVALVGVFAR